MDFPLPLLLLKAARESTFDPKARNDANPSVYGILQLSEGAFLEQIYKNRKLLSEFPEPFPLLARGIETFDENASRRRAAERKKKGSGEDIPIIIGYRVKPGFSLSRILERRSDPYISGVASILLSRFHLRLAWDAAPTVAASRLPTWADTYATHILGWKDGAKLLETAATKPDTPVSKFLAQHKIDDNHTTFKKNGRVLTAGESLAVLKKYFGTAPLPGGADIVGKRPTQMASRAGAPSTDPGPL